MSRTYEVQDLVTVPAEARDHADEGLSSRLSADRDFLLAELARAVGLGGRDRRLASPTERAGVACARRIRKANQTIAAHHPELAEHLRTTVRTGTFCCDNAVDRPA